MDKRYNVEVQGILVWIIWTRNRAEAVAEFMGWQRIEEIQGRDLGVKLKVERLGKPLVSTDSQNQEKTNGRSSRF